MNLFFGTPLLSSSLLLLLSLTFLLSSLYDIRLLEVVAFLLKQPQQQRIKRVRNQKSSLVSWGVENHPKRCRDRLIPSGMIQTTIISSISRLILSLLPHIDHDTRFPYKNRNRQRIACRFFQNFGHDLRIHNSDSHTNSSSTWIDDTDSSRMANEFIHIHNITRIFCLSDLHTDNIDNMKWLERNIKNSDLSHDDLMIVAGDICHDMKTFQHSIHIIRQKCQVLFVPGNHEAWLDDYKNMNTSFHSIHKVNMVEDICRDYGCYVDPIYIHGLHPLWIIPLKSWYDGTLSFNETLCQGFEYWPWIDFTRCSWPFPLYDIDTTKARIPKGLVQYYHHMINQPFLNKIQEEIYIQNSQKNEHTTLPGIITVSHFLPNQQCLPDWKDLNAKEFDSNTWLDHGAGAMSAKFAKVAGSILLDEQIRNIIPQPKQPQNGRIINEQKNDHDEHDPIQEPDGIEYMNRRIHIFGHSHRPKDFEYKNVRYIHHPLGKPRERQLQMISPHVQWKYIWNTEMDGEIIPPYSILRYWEEHGNGMETFQKHHFEKSRKGRMK
jgi:predicted phosphodiesterase